MKPMLSATIENIEDLKYPLYGSPKLDGIRALVVDGQLVSRNLKPIPNKYVNRNLPLERMNGWDGELIVGKPDSPDVFRVTTSGVMSAEGEPDFTFWAFDYVPSAEVSFEDRFTGLALNIRNMKHQFVRLVPQVRLKDSFEVHTYEEKMLDKGFEGIMLRSMDGMYKFGRSTLKEGYLMKLKRFLDSEAVIIGFDERMHNANTKTTDELGHAKRSSHKANMQPTGTLGALRVIDTSSDVEFDVGTGFDDSLRAEIWANRKVYLGKTIKYKYFPTGSKDKPRFPVFLGIRKD